MNKLTYPLICSILVAFMTSCNDTSIQAEDLEDNPQVETALQTGAVSAERAKVDSIWALIDSTEDDMRITVNRIIQEVKWSGEGNASAIATIEVQVKELDKYRYTQTSIPSSDQLDKDFPEVDAILSNVIELANSLPNREKYIILDDLFEDLQSYTGDNYATLMANYSSAVEEYNKGIKQENPEAETLPSYQDEEPAIQ